ncbi:hypothetical protein GCM10007414_25380 [Agarivorans gilvus]|uniref:Uncharacterized protein n=1 Tax=Agarivorans gilvus TaxID=680279 RepID=A0ABQ1I4C5_9ALTE|nr:hypothetical protein GCM10007414_25380 [Agarivorans gilvus]
MNHFYMCVNYAGIYLRGHWNNSVIGAVFYGLGENTTPEKGKNYWVSHTGLQSAQRLAILTG